MNTTTSNTAQLIRNLIVTGKLVPNENINSEKLCKDYGLEKKYLAEACATLENDGFITYSNGGFIVRELSETEITIWLQKRISLELEIIEKLAVNFNYKKLSIIQGSVKQQRDAVLNNNVVKFLEMNAEFHSHLATLAGFPTAARWFKLESARLKVREFQALNTELKLKNCFNEHLEIVDALKTKQPEVARNAMKRHLQKTEERLKNNKDI